MKSLGQAKALTGLIGLSNLALLVSSTANAVDAHDSGNRGLMYANITRMLSYSMFAAGPALYLLNIRSATAQSGWFALIAFAFLLVAEEIAAKYHKSELEKLLSSCFWGKSKKYHFGIF
ncbi:hypothetical protein [Vibrio mexicanus]|uniref:hypothetical protein n=1 Tax=Vibrio mexicanus TaxID=1004326 RepID=UPI0012FC6AE0|nr:hypothetical protein [Vibrio mexicanus]